MSQSAQSSSVATSDGGGCGAANNISYATWDAPEKLYEESKRRQWWLAKARTEREQELQREELDPCSFRPIICPGSATYERNIVDEFSANVFNRLAKDRKPFYRKLEQQREGQMERPTFTPRVLHNAVESEFLEQYGSIDISRRLYGDAVVRSEKKNSRSADIQKYVAERSTAHIRSAQRTPPARCINLYRESKEHKREISLNAVRQRLLEEEDFTFRPNINRSCGVGGHLSSTTSASPMVVKTQSVERRSRLANERIQQLNEQPVNPLQSPTYRANRAKILQHNEKYASGAVTERLLSDVAARRSAAASRNSNCPEAAAPSHRDKKLTPQLANESVARLIKPVACQDRERLEYVRRMMMEDQHRQLDSALTRSNKRLEEMRRKRLLEPGAVQVRQRSCPASAIAKTAELPSAPESMVHHRAHQGSASARHVDPAQRAKLAQVRQRATQSAILRVAETRKAQLNESRRREAELSGVGAVKYPAPLKSMPSAVPVRDEAKLLERNRRAQELRAMREAADVRPPRVQSAAAQRIKDDFGVHTAMQPFPNLEAHEHRSRQHKRKVLHNSLVAEGCTFRPATSTHLYTARLPPSASEEYPYEPLDDPDAPRGDSLQPQELSIHHYVHNDYDASPR